MRNFRFIIDFGWFIYWYFCLFIVTFIWYYFQYLLRLIWGLILSRNILLTCYFCLRLFRLLFTLRAFVDNRIFYNLSFNRGFFRNLLFFDLRFLWTCTFTFRFLSHHLCCCRNIWFLHNYLLFRSSLSVVIFNLFLFSIWNWFVFLLFWIWIWFFSYKCIFC